MHAVELIGIASTIAALGRSMLASGRIAINPALQDYWLTTRFRHENWSHRLAEHRHAIQDQGTSARTRRWHEILPVMQEVILSEPLTRVLAYLGKVAEESTKGCHGEGSEAASIAYNALSMHVETRHRCLHLIVFGQGIPVDLAVRINRLRRTVEDFNDQLLSALPRIANAAPFCFDSPVLDQSQIAWERNASEPCIAVLHARLLEMSWKRNSAADVDGRIANPKLNKRISEAAIGLLPREMFDGFGVARTPESWRYVGNSPDSDGKTGDLIAPLESPLDILTANPRPMPQSRLSSRWKEPE